MARQRATRRKQIVLSSSENDDEITPTKKRNGSQKADTASTFKSVTPGSPSISQPKITSIFESPKKIHTIKTESPRSKKSPKKPDPNERTLHSFFSNAIPSRPQLGKQKKSFQSDQLNAEDLVDLIQDDSADDGSLNISKDTAPSSVVSVAQKRNLASREGVIDDYAIGEGQRPKFFKNASGDRTNAPSGQYRQKDDTELLPWTERFPPLNLDELAVHKKKIADVRSWLSDTFAGKTSQSVLLLKGSAGTGKTTTISLLSRLLEFDIQQWRNPTSSNNLDGLQSTSAQFEDFIARAGRYQTLELTGPSQRSSATQVNENGTARKQAILIEEFPTSFSHSSPAVQAFRRTISQYLSSSNGLTNFYGLQEGSSKSTIPLIIIVSETLASTNSAAIDSFTAHRLLGPELLGHPGLHSIEFNPIAPTILSKALELVVIKEARRSGRKRTPGPKVIASLAEVGDVRSAISSLQFLCVRGDEADYWGGKINFSKNKKSSKSAPLTQGESESIQLVTQRESSLGLFHAVGKVVYNKRDLPSDTLPPVTQPPAYLPQHTRSKVSEVDVEKLVDELGSDIQTFVAALHENYVLSCDAFNTEETLDCVNGCLDALSDSDIISPDRFSSNNSRIRNFQGTGSESLRQSEIVFQNCVRGILFSLPSPVKRMAPPPSFGLNSIAKKADAFKMFYPSSLRMWRQIEESESLLDMWIHRTQNGYDFNLQKIRRLASNTVERKTYHAQSESQDPENINAENVVSILTGGGSSARNEMLLERLPYIALLLRSRQSETLRADRESIEKLTRFTGVSGPIGGIPDEDEEESNLEEQEKTKGSGRKKSRSKGALAGETMEQLDVSKMVLSDDDIED